MSLWTHVAGAVRIDAICHTKQDDERLHDLITQTLGSIVYFDSPEEVWESQHTPPQGSEGSLRYYYHTTADIQNQFPRGILVVEGDLRDFGTTLQLHSIQSWLNKLTSPDCREAFDIRQGIIQMSVGNGYSTLVYDHDLQSFAWEHQTGGR